MLTIGSKSAKQISRLGRNGQKMVPTGTAPPQQQTRQVTTTAAKTKDEIKKSVIPEPDPRTAWEDAHGFDAYDGFGPWIWFP